jgi:hypothetical protein
MEVSPHRANGVLVTPRTAGDTDAEPDWSRIDMEDSTSTVPDLTADEYDAIYDLNLPTEDARTEFAVVYFRRGKLVAEGPFEERRLAEVRVQAKGGVIAERPVITDFGLWTASDPNGYGTEDPS